MNLVINEWNDSDFQTFYEYLYSLRNEEKRSWSKNILCTNIDTLAIVSKTLHDISKKIYKGNYVSFLDNVKFKYYEVTVIYAYLISLIKDFNLQKKYINKLNKVNDCWATTDSIKFSIKGNEDSYFKYALTLITSKKTFERRVGFRILFHYDKNIEYYDRILDVVKSNYGENEYYVNMMISWLLCEFAIVNFNKIYEFLKDFNNTNEFVFRKSISKCMDSYRITEEQKDKLRNLRTKRFK